MISPADILSLVKTQEEANEFQKQIDHLLSMLFTNVPFETAVQETISFDKQGKLLSIFNREHVNVQQIQALQTILQEIKKTIAQLPIITISLAFEPKQRVIETIVTWLLAHTKRPALIHIIVDRSLIGGAILEYKGILKDYSLRKILQEKYQQGDLGLTG